MSTLEMLKNEGKIEGKIEGKVEGEILQAVRTLLTAIHHSPEMDTSLLSSLTGFSKESIEQLKESLQKDSVDQILQNMQKWFFSPNEIPLEDIEELKSLIALAKN